MNTNQQGGDMYQASDGKWYPRTSMPAGWQGQQGQQAHGQPQYGQQYGMQQGQYGGGYGQQQQQQYGGQQPIYVQQGARPGMGAGAAGGAGCCAALCGALLCFDLGACLF